MCTTRRGTGAARRTTLKTATTKTATPRTTAPETYAQRAGDIARLIDLLRARLDTHAAAAKADPANWGRVGDLGRVRADLINTVAFISGMDPERVEAFLAE